MTDTWWRLVARSVSDHDRLVEVMQKGTATGAVLRKLGSGQTGRSSSELELRRNLVPAKFAERAKATLLSWGKHDPEDYGVEAAPFEGEPVEQIEALIDQPISEVDWDEGAIIYEMPEGERVTFEPGNLRDVFTYPLRIGSAIDFDDLEKEAKKRAQPLMKALRLELELE